MTPHHLPLCAQTESSAPDLLPAQGRHVPVTTLLRWAPLPAPALQDPLAEAARKTYVNRVLAAGAAKRRSDTLEKFV